MLKTVFICLIVVYFLIYLLFAAKTGKPFKTIFLYSFLGVLGMVLVNLFSSFSGVYIPVNGYSAGFCASMGLPGTVALLIIKLIFLY